MPLFPLFNIFFWQPVSNNVCFLHKWVYTRVGKASLIIIISDPVVGTVCLPSPKMHKKVSSAYFSPSCIYKKNHTFFKEKLQKYLVQQKQNKLFNTIFKQTCYLAIFHWDVFFFNAKLQLIASLFWVRDVFEWNCH